MAKIKILQGMFLATALFMAFLYVNSPFEEIKSMTLIVNFFLLASTFLFIIFITTPKLKDIELSGGKEFFEEYAIGAVLGLIANVFVMTLAFGLDKVINFTGSITPMSIQLMSDTALLFLVHFLPLTETIILIGTTVVVGSFLSKRVPMPLLVGGIIASLFFAAFHFAAVAGPLSTQPGVFEYSVDGFVKFVTSMDGALIHFSFGFFSVLLFLGFRSFIILYSVHHLNNLLVAVQALGWTDLLVALAAIDVGLVLLAVMYAKPMVKLNQFSLKRVFA